MPEGRETSSVNFQFRDVPNVARIAAVFVLMVTTVTLQGPSQFLKLALVPASVFAEPVSLFTSTWIDPPMPAAAVSAFVFALVGASAVRSGWKEREMMHFVLLSTVGVNICTALTAWTLATLGGHGALRWVFWGACGPVSAFLVAVKHLWPGESTRICCCTIPYQRLPWYWTMFSLFDLATSPIPPRPVNFHYILGMDHNSEGASFGGGPGLQRLSVTALDSGAAAAGGAEVSPVHYEGPRVVPIAWAILLSWAYMRFIHRGGDRGAHAELRTLLPWAALTPVPRELPSGRAVGDGGRGGQAAGQRASVFANQLLRLGLFGGATANTVGQAAPGGVRVEVFEGRENLAGLWQQQQQQ
eukprot:Hpha_TRINITY_DN15550_c4_g2::TRINITY_DN15550_c4_g2_i1::g.104418::m.104418